MQYMEKSSFVLSVSSASCTGANIISKRTPAVITIPDLVLTEGKNLITIPGNKGCLELVKRGDQFLELVLINVAGYATRLTHLAAGTHKVPCEWPVPDACYGLPDDDEAGLYCCRSADASKDAYTITIKKAMLYAL